MINLVIWFKSGKSERFKNVKNFDSAVSHNGALFIQFEYTSYTNGVQNSTGIMLRGMR